MCVCACVYVHGVHISYVKSATVLGSTSQFFFHIICSSNFCENTSLQNRCVLNINSLADSYFSQSVLFNFRVYQKHKNIPILPPWIGSICLGTITFSTQNIRLRFFTIWILKTGFREEKNIYDLFSVWNFYLWFLRNFFFHVNFYTKK